MATHSISTVEARENFSDLINQAAYGNQRIVLTRRGKSLVAIIPLKDLKTLERYEAEKAERVTEEA